MKKLRVLLVDDEIMIREGFKKLFDWEAHECVVVGEAADGMEAITKIDEEQPDIVIMDYQRSESDSVKPGEISVHGFCDCFRLR